MASRSQRKSFRASGPRAPTQRDLPISGGNAHGTVARLQGLLIIALGLWIFSPVLRGDWLWDDDKFITHNDLIHDPAGFWKVWVSPDGLGNYDPLTSAVRWLQWQSWGDNPLGYHLTSVALHLASAFLIWRLFSRLRIPGAWFGALIFTIHPVMVESVAWIAELKNTLSLPPLLLAMLALLNYDENGRRRADFLRALAWFAVAMLAKTSGLMLPVVFLGYAWFKRGKIGADEIKASAPFFLIALVAAVVSIFPHHDPDVRLEIVASGGWAARLASLGWAGLFLLGKALVPVCMMPAYPGNAVEVPTLVDLFPWLLLFVGLCLGWNWRKTWGLPVLAGLGFFLVNLVPVFGFIAMNYATMVWSMDHLIYLPIIGLIGLFASIVGVTMKSLTPRTRPLGIGAATLVVAFLTIASHSYAAKFSDEETLWSYAVNRAPHFLLAQENLGKALLVENRPDEASVHFDEAIRLNPRRAAAHFNLGQALVQMGSLEAGIAQYHQALAIDPTNAETENNLGIALVQSGKIPEAVGHFQQAVLLRPDYAIAYDNLGGALALSGRYQEAIDSFAEALKLTPESTEVHDNMGTALLKLGRQPEAIAQFQQALHLDPDDAKALENLTKLQQLDQKAPEPAGNQASP
jgi:tetratricopeptide (TPR) repeat protein